MSRAASAEPDYAGPFHGDRGTPVHAAPGVRPRSLTVALNREAGARGTSVAEAVARLLGWQVFPQPMLDFLANDEGARAELLDDLPPGSVAWASDRAEAVLQARGLAGAPDTAALVRLVFALAARGESVLVGRGAGFLLPAESTVHVRVVAPFPERVAYLGQRLRLTEPEAAREARQRDARRASFLGTLTDAAIGDPSGYDLFVNTGRLSVEACAELVAGAVRGRHLTPDPVS